MPSTAAATTAATYVGSSQETLLSLLVAGMLHVAHQDPVLIQIVPSQTT
jgi:hypothetical protein